MKRDLALSFVAVWAVGCQAVTGNFAVGSADQDSGDSSHVVVGDAMVAADSSQAADGAQTMEAAAYDDSGDDGAAVGACTQGATQCSGNGVQTCADGGQQWGTAVTCDASACVGGACTGVCTPGAVQCAPDGGLDGGGVETCAVNGTWESAVPCANSTCAAGACSGSCSTGAVQCSGTSAVQSCASGMWAAPTSCNDHTCASGACTSCLTWVLGGIGVPSGTVATASTTATARAAAYAIDGNLTTVWNSGTHAASWLTLQFPTPQTITGIRVAGGLVPGCDETYTITRAGTSTVIGHALESTTSSVVVAGMYAIEPVIPVTPGAYSGITISITDASCSWIQITDVSLVTTACP